MLQADSEKSLFVMDLCGLIHKTLNLEFYLKIVRKYLNNYNLFWMLFQLLTKKICYRTLIFNLDIFLLFDVKSLVCFNKDIDHNFWKAIMNINRSCKRYIGQNKKTLLKKALARWQIHR